jgi:hypothetical protein
VILGFVSGQVDGGEPADPVPVSVPVVRFVFGFGVESLGDPRLHVERVDDVVEPADVVAVAVCNHDPFGLHSDLGDSLDERVRGPFQACIEQRRRPRREQEGTEPLPLGFVQARDVVHVFHDFDRHVTETLPPPTA